MFSYQTIGYHGARQQKGLKWTFSKLCRKNVNKIMSYLFTFSVLPLD